MEKLLIYILLCFLFIGCDNHVNSGLIGKKRRVDTQVSYYITVEYRNDRAKTRTKDFLVTKEEFEYFQEGDAVYFENYRIIRKVQAEK